MKLKRADEFTKEELISLTKAMGFNIIILMFINIFLLAKLVFKF